MHYPNPCILLYTLGLLEKEDSETKETGNGNRYSSSAVLVAQSCPTLCDHMDYSPPASSVHGILQARILEWVAIPFSRGSSQLGIEPASLHWQADSLPSELQGRSKAGAALPQELLPKGGSVRMQARKTDLVPCSPCNQIQ